MKPNREKSFLLRLFIAAFTLSVCVSAISYGTINIYGLFGEIKAETVTSEAEMSIRVTSHESKIIAERHSSKIKQVCNIDLALLLLIIIICFIKYKTYSVSLPEVWSLISLKVRLDN